MIEIEKLSFAYRSSSPIFADFDWNIARDERWSVIGPSGCGKTTLLYLLAGLYLPNSGRIAVNGIPLLKPRMSTGLILQDYGLLPWATAFENISLGLRIRRWDRPRVIRTTGEWLRRLGIDDVAHHYPAELSGGQRQRVAIARTLAFEPDLLLMDEPFASLDALTREDLQNLTISLWEQVSTTITLVTHNIEEATVLGKRILVLKPAPNSRPTVVENPDSGNAAYRGTPEFTARCRQLRELVALDARNGVTPLQEDRP